MRLHANAALTLSQRRRMVRLVVEQGWSPARAAAEFKTSPKTCSKWVARYREASEAGLLDRCSACERVANRTDERRTKAIAALRRLRFTGPEIAELLDMPVSTVSGILTRIGMGRLGRLGLEPAQRYERARPGELVHIDVKKRGQPDLRRARRGRDRGVLDRLPQIVGQARTGRRAAGDLRRPRALLAGTRVTITAFALASLAGALVSG
jgi:transposase